jgi:hypothetical protein
MIDYWWCFCCWFVVNSFFFFTYLIIFGDQLITNSTNFLIALFYCYCYCYIGAIYLALKNDIVPSSVILATIDDYIKDPITCKNIQEHIKDYIDNVNVKSKSKSKVTTDTKKSNSKIQNYTDTYGTGTGTFVYGTDFAVGVKIKAQWKKRSTYYPGVISSMIDKGRSIGNREFDIIYEDGGKEYGVEERFCILQVDPDEFPTPTPIPFSKTTPSAPAETQNIIGTDGGAPVYITPSFAYDISNESAAKLGLRTEANVFYDHVNMLCKLK